MNDNARHRQQRDREKTSGAILSTATSLFLEHGYAAVSLSLIAQQAGVTKSLLHHYFGDKRGLQQAVKDACVASYAEQQRVLFSAHPTKSGLDVTASIDAYFSFLQKQPEVARMFALESFEGEIEPSTTEQELQVEGLAYIRGLQKRHTLRDDIGPDMIQALFIALTEHWFISRERVAKLNGTKTGDDLDARYIDAVNKLFTAGLQIDTGREI